MGFQSVRKFVLRCAFTLNSLLMVNYAFKDFEPVAAARSRLDIRHQGATEVSALGRSVWTKGAKPLSALGHNQIM